MENAEFDKSAGDIQPNEKRRRYQTIDDGDDHGLDEKGSLGDQHVDDARLAKKSEYWAGHASSSSGNAVNEDRCAQDDEAAAKPVSQVQMGLSGFLQLPRHLLEDILTRLEDARHIAKAQCVCRDFRAAGFCVRSLRLNVVDKFHQWKRTRSHPVLPFMMDMPFKSRMLQILMNKHHLTQIHIEVEPKLQAKTVRESEFWISDPVFLRLWLNGMGSTLQHLSIVDYKQQAIMHRSSILKILSISCKLLRTLDLRNMSLDTTNFREEMNLMASLTLRCVKVDGNALQHINDRMPNLQSLVLLDVSGAEGGLLAFQHMKVLSLGLSTPARDVVMSLPELEKLQLKMQCPQKLIIMAPPLQYVAFNLEVLEPSVVDLKSMIGLRELMYRASSFVTLKDLVFKNVLFLKKVFLDIPPMILSEDDVPWMLQDFSRLHFCGALEVLSIGPGLWRCMEMNGEMLASLEEWPSMSHLILHIIPQNVDTTIRALRMLLRPSVSSLIIYVHTSSPIKLDDLAPAIEEVVLDVGHIMYFLLGSWTKSLDLSCFSFRS